MKRILVLLSGLALLATTSANAQNRPSTTNWAKDPVWRIKANDTGYDTLSRAEFRAHSGGVNEVDDCDTTQQTFIYVRKPSPWRIGMFLGPSIAYCGTWQGTFGDNRRDQTLFNGFGFRTSLNADYFFPSRSRFKFGLGAEGGYQVYFSRNNASRAFLNDIANRQGVSLANMRIEHRPSEDLFLTVGPVISWAFKDGPRSAFLEAAIRGGLFRTEAATLAAYDQTTRDLVYLVSPSARVLRPGFLGNIGVFFPLRNPNWHLGVQGGGFYSLVDYYIATNEAKLFDFTRKHGGWHLGVGVRHNLQRRKLIPKAAIVCPTCEEIPTVAVSFDSTSLAGQTLPWRYMTGNVNPVISWKSTTNNPMKETFTARLHYKDREQDVVIAEKASTTDTTMTWPTSHVEQDTATKTTKPTRGYYYVTVQSEQKSTCGQCFSPVASTSFAFSDTTCAEPRKCQFSNEIKLVDIIYHTSKGVQVECYCMCGGTRTKTGETRRVFRRVYGTSSLMGTTDEVVSEEFGVVVTPELEKMVEDRWNEIKRTRRGAVRDYVRVIYSVDQVCEGGCQQGREEKHITDLEVRMNFQRDGKLKTSTTQVLTAEQLQKRMDEAARRNANNR